MLGNGIGQFLELTNLRAVGLIQIRCRTCPCHQGVSNAYELQIILGIDWIWLMFDKGGNGQKIGQEPSLFRGILEVPRKPYVEFRMKIGHDTGIPGGACL